MTKVPERVEDIIDPRQIKTIAFWRNPKSDTFGNVKASAMRAGYAESYADTLSACRPQWFLLSARKDVERVLRAEQYLDEVQGLNIKIENSNLVNIDVARLKLDVTKLVLKTLARSKYTEEEDKVPPSVQINLINYAEDSKPVAHVIEPVSPLPEPEGL